MCGICGVIQIGGDPRPVVTSDVLDRMTDCMTHRGPNDRGTYSAEGVALGVRRLSIVDVEGGHQPFASEDDHVWAIQNGELYNHDRLRAELRARGHAFQSRCDTEVLPHLYEEEGTRFAERLRGKFGIAVWDEARRRAVLARDRLGVKPLYWARADDLLVFASELKSLLASGLVEPDLDYVAIDSLLTFGFVPGPRTPLAGVSKLLPGHRLVVEPGGVRLEQYWAYPKPKASPSTDGVDAYARGLLAELEESVRLRLMSDVPLGAMLSGGLDSSLIVALMARNMAEPVKTFSIGFVESRDDNELPDARQIAELFGTDHHELELSYADQTLDLGDLVWHLDEPIAELSALGFHALSQLAARHVRVALSGQGADELLGGYKKHKAAALVGRWRRLPAPLAAAGATVAARAPGRLMRAGKTLAALDPASRLVAMSSQVDEALRAQLYRGPLADLDGDGPRQVVAVLAAGVDDDPLPVTLHIDGQLALVDNMLAYFDRTSMAHSLEVRVPFLDHRVVEYCSRIPAELKVRRLTTKYVLRHAARGVLPNNIIDKRKLGFFRGASAGWLKAQMSGAVSTYLLDSRPCYAEFLDRHAVERLVRRHLDGTDTSHVHLLMSILMLEVWLSTYLPRALGTTTRAGEQLRVAAR
jgi:asparagine synthase (glutamine-hydrolysing)